MKSRVRINLPPALVVLLVALVAGANAFPIFAETADASGYDPASCLKLVQETAANEVAANNNSQKHMFRARKQTPQGSQTRLYVETRDAMAGMTIAYNDKPLAPQDMQNENGRLAGLASNAEQLRRKHAQEQENADRTLRIVKALPDAFLYQYDGEQVGDDRLGSPGRTLLRLRFRPNPAYQPPTHAEQVLVGMNGVLVIDPVAHRIAQIDGTLFREVAFGWGILGHLDPGGHFLVEQRDVGNGCWEVSRMSLDFSGKILLFKSLAIKSEEVFSDFRRVPDGTTFAQGVEMLKAEEVKLAQNHFAETIKTANKSR
ncbi:MAG: hypothetical protein WCD47_20835 [Candidatus Sulfotelmatobacter sp.]